MAMAIRVDTELFFKALADRTRLRIINLVDRDEICVCVLVEVLNISQPKISRHLAYLRRAKVVSNRRDGKWVHYKIVDPDDLNLANILRDIRELLRSDSQMQRDLARLNQICSTPELAAPLRKAPRPASVTR
jgi:ArsR family transcriptional regulator, arsenate/arsenite/antimonite-responsive transcriptional repressor